MQSAQRYIALHFTDLNLNPKLLEAIEREGYTEPTDIQKQAIPVILEGRDVLGLAQTGTGKTAAFALPVLHQLAEGDRSKRPRALILAPTRELARQVAESFSTYGKRLKLRCTVVYGGVPQRPQVRALRDGVDILIATPGRLLDLFDQGYVNLSEVQTFILDEADHMLDMGFIHPIRQIASELPEQRQTLMFSATMPRSIENLASSLLNNPAQVTATRVASTAPKIEQHLYFVPQTSKSQLLIQLLRKPEADRVIVFTRTKHGADRVAQNLSRSKINAAVIHGNKSQNARRRALSSFKEGACRVLVATDVAARGIDVEGITHVVNYNIPNEPESYIHRIGRTGRAGATGVALSFCDHSERRYLRNIERLTQKRMEVQEPENLDTPSADGGREPSRDAAGPNREVSSSTKRTSTSNRDNSSFGADRPQNAKRTSESNRNESAPDFGAKRSPGRKKHGSSASKRPSGSTQSARSTQSANKPQNAMRPNRDAHDSRGNASSADRDSKRSRRDVSVFSRDETSSRRNGSNFSKRAPGSNQDTSGAAKDATGSSKRGPKPPMRSSKPKQEGSAFGGRPGGRPGGKFSEKPRSNSGSRRKRVFENS